MTWILFAALLVAQAPSMPAPAPPADAQARAQAALAAITAGNFGAVEAQFTPNMVRAYPTGRLAAMWAALTTQGGGFKACAPEGRVVDIDAKRMVITPCMFERLTIDLQFAFDTAARISGMTIRPRADVAYTPPAYVRDGAFTEDPITIGADWPLPGTLTLPTGTGRVPAAVLVHGSGPSDRDGTLGPNKPRKDIALGLAARGIAVLRFDKRTLVHRDKVAALPGQTVEDETVQDLVEAVKVLRRHPRVDPDAVYVIGHSLGAMVAPRIAAREPAVAGLVLLAAPTRPLHEIIVAQTRYLAALDGSVSAEEQRTIDTAVDNASVIRSLTAADGSSTRRIAGASPAYWLDLRAYDPVEFARRFTGRMLILQGERDYQVTMEDFAGWKAAFGERSDVALRSYPGLNHLFMAGTGPASPVEYLTPAHVADEVITDITAWILQARK
jgi:pimeloyl-ACP methyl ester carboxylesterase